MKFSDIYKSSNRSIEKKPHKKYSINWNKGFFYDYSFAIECRQSLSILYDVLLLQFYNEKKKQIK